MCIFLYKIKIINFVIKANHIMARPNVYGPYDEYDSSKKREENDVHSF